MKISIAALTFALLLSPVAAARTADELWPTDEGNRWTFEVRSSTGPVEEETMRVLRRSGIWSRIDGFEGDRWWSMSRSSGRLFVWNPAAGTSSAVFDLALDPGFVVYPRIEGAPCLDGSSWRNIARERSFSTPIGTLAGCVLLEVVEPSCADAGYRKLVFAPGIGPVFFERRVPGGLETGWLVHAVVGGVEHRRPAPVDAGGLVVALRLDGRTYRPGADLGLRLVVDNEGRTAFDLGQPVTAYALTASIRRTDGRPVRRIASAVGVPYESQALSLVPGATVLADRSIDLNGDDGRPLAPGTYSIEVVQSFGPGLEFRATSLFRVAK